MALDAVSSSPAELRRHHRHHNNEHFHQRSQQQRCSMDAICEDIINRSHDSISSSAKQLSQQQTMEGGKRRHQSTIQEEEQQEQHSDDDDGFELLRDDSRSFADSSGLDITIETPTNVSQDLKRDSLDLPKEEEVEVGVEALEALEVEESLLIVEHEVSQEELGQQQQHHRIFNKRTQSASEVRYHKLSSNSSLHHLTPNNNNYHSSPSSKSVKSLSALSPPPLAPLVSTPSSGSSSSSRSWSRSLHKGGIRRIKKRSLNALFDAVGAGQAVRRKEAQSPSPPVGINRTNSVSAGATHGVLGGAKSDLGLVKLDVDGDRDGEEDNVEEREDLNTLQLTRLATSDLRDLERRFHSTERVSPSRQSQGDGEQEEGQNEKKPSPHPQAYFTIDSRRLASRHKKSLRDKKLLYGVKQFNLEPSRGIKFLAESGFLQTGDAKATALFLFREGRLSKKQIGKFIGGHEDFNREVLREFVQLHQFTHLILVQALRQFLWSFRLPGEAMQIDRIMESFAGHYCAQNPDLFDEPDTCYVICFSIIMLNTALHNPNVKQKITVDQFVRQNRGINSGKDLPRDILELIYRSIKEEPFKIPDETYDDLMYTFFSPEREGWLMKQGGSWKNWKRRWFVLSDRCLYYFQHTAENVPKGIIPLENVRVRTVPDVDAHNGFAFEVISTVDNAIVKGCKTDSRGTVVQGNHKAYRMSTTTAEDRTFWVQAIQESIREHPFHHIVAAKKAALLRKQQLQQQNQQHSHLKTSMSDSPKNTPKKQHSSVLEKMLLTPKRRDTPTKKPSESAPDLRANKSNNNSPLKEREVV